MLILSCLAVSLTLSATSHSRVQADTVTFTDTTQIVLTSDDLTHSISFLQAYMKQPQQLRTAVESHLIKFSTITGYESMGIPTPDVVTPNMLLAAKNPAIAQNFKQANLTPDRYVLIHRAVGNAVAADGTAQSLNGGAAPPSDTSTVLGKNVAFVRNHAAAVDSLEKAGMFINHVRFQVEH